MTSLWLTIALVFALVALVFAVLLILAIGHTYAEVTERRARELAAERDPFSDPDWEEHVVSAVRLSNAKGRKK